jgi:hypothetical protein
MRFAAVSAAATDGVDRGPGRRRVLYVKRDRRTKAQSPSPVTCSRTPGQPSPWACPPSHESTPGYAPKFASGTRRRFSGDHEVVGEHRVGVLRLDHKAAARADHIVRRLGCMEEGGPALQGLEGRLDPVPLSDQTGAATLSRRWTVATCSWTGWKTPALGLASKQLTRLYRE